MCLFWTQRKIFWRKCVIRLFWGTIDFNSRTKILLFLSFFRISSFVFRTNTFIQVWNCLRVSKWWLKFHFWVHCLFKRELEDTKKQLEEKGRPETGHVGHLCRFCKLELKQGSNSPHIHTGSPGVAGKYVYSPPITSLRISRKRWSGESLTSALYEMAGRNKWYFLIFCPLEIFHSCIFWFVYLSVWDCNIYI